MSHTEQRAERLRLYMNRIGELETEVERLTALVVQQSRKHDADMLVERLRNPNVISTAVRSEAAAEIEQLRAALQALADDTSVSPWIRTLARRALELKP